MSIVNTIVNLLATHKGANTRIAWKRQAKVKKACPFIIQKETRAIVRAGIDYSNLASVKNSGIDVGPLPWGEWNAFPFSISHKGNDYIRLYQAGGIAFSPKVVWYVNGVETEKSAIEPWLLSSEKLTGESPETFTVKAKDIIEVGENVLA